MSIIEIHMFGRFELHAGEQVLTSFQCQKALELFCYLLINRERPHNREMLAELFWDNRSTIESRKYFRKTLWQLQSELDKITIGKGNQIFIIEPDWLQCNHNMDIWLDILEFEKLCASFPGYQDLNFNPMTIQTLEMAEKMYRGDLLEGWYQDWCIYERERFKDLYFNLVDTLMGYYENNHDYDTAVKYGYKLLSYDRAREGTHLRMMRNYYLMGERTNAIRQFNICREALRREFDLEPSESVWNLFHHIVNDHAYEPHCGVYSTYNQEGEPILRVMQSLEKIKRLVAIQASIPAQIQNELNAIEESLSSIR